MNYKLFKKIIIIIICIIMQFNVSICAKNLSESDKSAKCYVNHEGVHPDAGKSVINIKDGVEIFTDAMGGEVIHFLTEEEKKEYKKKLETTVEEVDSICKTLRKRYNILLLIDSWNKCGLNVYKTTHYLDLLKIIRFGSYHILNDAN